VSKERTESEDRAQLAGVLQRSGLGCADFAPPDPDAGSFSIGVSGATKAGCTIQGDQAGLNVFKDSGQLNNWLGALATIGCQFGKSFGVTTIPLVVGPTWTLGGAQSSEATTTLIAKRLHIKSRVIHCKEAARTGVTLTEPIGPEPDGT
jgi:hypothetical protein